MPPIHQNIESLLFIAGKPLTFKKLAQLIDGATAADIAPAVEALRQRYEENGGGLRIAVTAGEAQMVTSGETANVAKKLVKDELTGELTKPSIETLTIIAYRGPVSKLELERIRGINCSLILRNLMLRGLVAAEEDERKRETYYRVTPDFLRHLNVTSAGDLPEYEQLRHNEDIEKFLAGEV